MTGSWVAPDACTLPTAEQPLRVAEFDDLFAGHLLGVERRGATRLALTFAGDGELAVVVADLADRESSCCSFFDFRVTSVPSDGGTTVRLEVSVPRDRADVLAALADRAETLHTRSRS